MIYVLMLIILYQCALIYFDRKSRDKSLQALMDSWQIERQQLLDRIQAPSFDHLKHAEIKKIKVEKEEEAPKYELL